MTHTDAKKVRQRIHAKKRALERYGLDLKTKDLKEIARLITEKPRANAQRLAVPTTRISIWRVNYHGMFLPVAWDWKSKTVASILPPHVLKRYTSVPIEYKCPFCRKKYGTEEKLSGHIIKAHRAS